MTTEPLNPVPAPPTLVEPESTPTGRRWWRRLLWPLVTVVALLAGVGIGYSASGSNPTESPEYQRLADRYDEAVLSNNQLEGLNEQFRRQRDTAQATAEQQAAELEARAAELDTREADLVAREAAVTLTEESIAANSVEDGVWVVGVDIEPGTYRAEGVSSTCYWAVLRSGTNGDDIIANDLPQGGNPTVTLEEGQDFDTARCGTWIKQ